jgi:large subunit ribosomal protein L21
MTLAVIKSGGKQYKVEEGTIVKLEKLEKNDGEKVEFDDILNGKKVVGSVMETAKGDKVRVFKYKNKTGYKKTQGHRQTFTKIKVESIS